jgi:hypothetical protein
VGHPECEWPRIGSRPLLRLRQPRQRDLVAAGLREKDYFFPNDPNLYAAQGPIIKCDEEDGLKRVDTYNTFSLDYITQQGILREGYVDWGMNDHFSLRGGRFILPIGLAPRDVGATSAKDMTRITRLNAEPTSA